jgi:hypothetical protein
VDHSHARHQLVHCTCTHSWQTSQRQCAAAAHGFTRDECSALQGCTLQMDWEAQVRVTASRGGHTSSRFPGWQLWPKPKGPCMLQCCSCLHNHFKPHSSVGSRCRAPCTSHLGCSPTSRSGRCTVRLTLPSNVEITKCPVHAVVHTRQHARSLSSHQLRAAVAPASRVLDSTRLITVLAQVTHQHGLIWPALFHYQPAIPGGQHS